MATILLIGSNGAMLEGLAQSLVNAGHITHHAHTAAQGVEIALADRPLVVVVERRSAESDPDALRIPLASGGAVLLCHAEEDAPSSLPAAMHRYVLADLTLPVALVGTVTWDPSWTDGVPLVIDAPTLTPSERIGLWAGALRGQRPHGVDGSATPAVV